MRASWDDARFHSFGAAVALSPEEVPLAEATGRVLVEEVLALYAIPHFASSAMDGWAVAGTGPWEVVDADRLAPASGLLLDGQAVAIATGHLVPRGTRAVLRSESGEVRDGRLALGPAAAADEPFDGQHIRGIGEEAQAGDPMIRAGTLLNPAHVALIGGCGYDTVTVVAEPRVSLVFTGDEVITAGIPGPGQVRDSFGPQLPAFVGMLGGRIAGAWRIGDDRAVTIAALREAAAASEVTVTTGGTGGSAVDHLRGALTTLGARLIVDGIAMRPGSPTLVAQLPGGPYVVALPGNPLAAMMGMLTVVAPLLTALRGGELAPLDTVGVAETVKGRAGTTRLMPYRDVDGLAVPNPWAGAGMLRGLADAAGVLLVPPEGVEAGAATRVLTPPWVKRA